MNVETIEQFRSSLSMLFAVSCTTGIAVSSSPIAFAGGVKTESGGTNSQAPGKSIHTGNYRIDFNFDPNATGTSNVKSAEAADKDSQTKRPKPAILMEGYRKGSS